MLTSKELAEIQARREATTPESWFVSRDFDVWCEKYMICATDYNSNMENDASFIAHVHKDVPALLDEVERLLALVERREARSLKAALAGMRHIAEMDAKNERLLAALRQSELAAMRATNGPEHARFVIWECGHCAREFKVYVSGHKDRVGKHETDCPFAMLERWR